LRAQREGGPRFDPSLTEEQRDAFANLVLMCSPHHTIVDSEYEHYSLDLLETIKAKHEAKHGGQERDTDGLLVNLLLEKVRGLKIVSNAETLQVNCHGAAQSVVINVKKSRSVVSMSPPLGTIGADAQKVRYISYLIKRYNSFAGADTRRTKRFRYAAITGTIDKMFRGPWRLLPEQNFGAVCDYLHGRISRTVIAKTNTGKGHRSYSTYQEFIESGETNARAPDV
jgi:hypothetical protein